LFRYVIPAILLPIGLLTSLVGAQDIHSNNAVWGIIIALLLPSISVGISRRFFQRRINIIKSKIES